MGGKSKEKTLPPQVAGPEPAYAPLRPALGGGGTPSTFQSLPGQLGLIAQQLNAGYPAMPQDALLKQLRSIYKPVTTGSPGMAAAKAAEAEAKKATPPSSPYNFGPSPSGGSWADYRGKGYGQGEMFAMPSDLLKFLYSMPTQGKK